MCEGEDESLDALLADKASAMYGSFYAAGTITAPLVGTFVFELLRENWNKTSDIFGLCGLAYSSIFLVFNVMSDIHLERKELERVTNNMLEKPEVL